jgi:DNA mismatch repair protein MutS
MSAKSEKTHHRQAAGQAAPTPMMAQYLAVKADYADCLLFYRMGDFYELFFDDAVTASRALDIQLTARGRHQGEDIPMCGVPAHAADDYLQRLIKHGFRVAVCEQMEPPDEAKKRGPKAVVRREVVRVVTAGTLTEEGLLAARENNFLLAIARNKAEGERQLALAWVDISTGDLTACAIERSDLAAELARLEPREIIISDALSREAAIAATLSDITAAIAEQPVHSFDSTRAADRIKAFFKVRALEGFGEFSRAELSALGALIGYIELTQIGQAPVIKPPRRLMINDHLAIDAATRGNLELVTTLAGEKAGSLLSVIDKTVTAAGARLIKNRLTGPSLAPDIINNRLDAVDYFAQSPDTRQAVRKALLSCPDLTRALARLSLGRGGPRDLGAIRDGLELAAGLPALFDRIDAGAALPEELAGAVDRLTPAGSGLADELQAMLADSLPHLARDGGFVRDGFSDELDDARRLRDQNRQVIASLQADYTARTDVKSLKIKHNNVLGYFVEVTAQHGDRLMAQPLNETFIHRQTLASAVRFTTVELGELEARILAAASKAQSIEQGTFDHFADQVNQAASDIAGVSEGLATLDLHAGLAELATRQDYVRPRVDRTLSFEIKGGRHPVVERALAKARAEGFVPNDCDLSADGFGDTQAARLWLLTGPNMAGKSTFLRQNALIAILAQMGSFVPAKSAHIGVIDKLFSRVGAADDLARGRSTFMVEMVETATILNQAGERSLVILDEIGRGTATFDGLSLAWASLEHLHGCNKSRTLFATHFHELTALAGQLEGLANATMKVREHDGEVIFLHEVAPGAADRSYGIQVAKLAGLPDQVLDRAAEVLSLLEQNDRQSGLETLAAELPLFAATRPQSKPAREVAANRLDEALQNVNPDELTPREALEALYRLKAEAQDN